MDPNSCLENVRDVLSQGDTEAARDGLRDYFGWRRLGGFEARDDGDARARQMAREARLRDLKSAVLSAFKIHGDIGGIIVRMEGDDFRLQLQPACGCRHHDFLTDAAWIPVPRLFKILEEHDSRFDLDGRDCISLRLNVYVEERV